MELLSVTGQHTNSNLLRYAPDSVRSKGGNRKMATEKLKISLQDLIINPGPINKLKFTKTDMNSFQTTDTVQKKPQNTYLKFLTPLMQVFYTPFVCGFSVIMVQKGPRYVDDDNI